MNLKIQGKGQPLLLIPGLGGCSKSFDYLVPHLDDFQVITFDPLGCGSNMSIDKNKPNIIFSSVVALIKDLQIEVLGEKLNKALTSKVFELQKYRSEFFGKLQSILGDRKDIKIVGDRFIFESELLFDSASADLQLSGKEKLSEIGLTLKETTNDIPSDIDWIIMVEGHTDNVPIKIEGIDDNWDLSVKRATSVIRILQNDFDVKPERMTAAGRSYYIPLYENDSPSNRARNRRTRIVVLPKLDQFYDLIEQGMGN